MVNKNSTIWNFENTGPCTGVFAMERDIELAQMLSAGIGQPTLRFYTWQPWTLSVGWHQSLEQINIDALKRDGFDLVRRPTGGRAVFHAQELTYSVVFEVDGESILQTYAYISKALLRGLQLLGVHASLEVQQPIYNEFYKTKSSIPCFSSSGKYEIMVGGKKLIGSAQRRYIGKNGNSVVLQHGSILLGPAHKMLLRYLYLTENERNALYRQLEMKTTELFTILNTTVPLDDIIVAFKRGFEEELKIQFIK